MILEIKDLNVTYNSKSNSPNAAVRGVSFALEENSFSGLIGESGSGKSTVIMTLLGLLPRDSAASGEILYKGLYKGRGILDIPEDEMASLRQREIALIPQGALNSFTPVMTIGRHLREVLELHLGLKGEAAERRIIELLADVELPHEIAARYPHELSGGQKQRAAIAIALSCEPKLVLADEPTTALDVITQAAILRLLERLRREKNLTILLVTHDLPLAASVCGELFVMKDGKLIESGTPRQLIDSPREAHTRALIAAML
ncbi:MAG: ABC transporter ATP-binding protein [Synergistaceae bacterium]|nr:ABC transporter ATP-binding protein [Synergistaceae bacterium]